MRARSKVGQKERCTASLENKQAKMGPEQWGCWPQALPLSPRQVTRSPLTARLGGAHVCVAPLPASLHWEKYRIRWPFSLLVSRSKRSDIWARYLETPSVFRVIPSWKSQHTPATHLWELSHSPRSTAHTIVPPELSVVGSTLDFGHCFYKSWNNSYFKL